MACAVFHPVNRGKAMSSRDYTETAAVFVGGSIGALTRAGLGTVFPGQPGHWPWVTFAVNIIGAFTLGYFTTRLLERLPLSSYRRPLLGTGLCGGLTTFSTMQVEILHLLGGGDWPLAIGYATASVTCGLMAVWLASTLVRRVQLVTR